MNTRQVITLWLIALILGIAVTAVKLNQGSPDANATKRARGETLFESLPVGDVATIEIKGAEHEVTLEREGSEWQVRERDGYPADSAAVRDILRTLADLKVTQGIEAGPTFASRFGMDESAASAADRGITLTLKREDAAEIATLSLGRSLEGSAAARYGGAAGRYVRNHADDSGFYVVSELFPTLSAEPSDWLDPAFITMEKIARVKVLEPKNGELLWEVARDDEHDDFHLVGAESGQALESDAAGSLRTLFSYARFEDVASIDQFNEQASLAEAREVTIETFEGFDYQLEITPVKGEEDEAAEQVPLDSGYFVTVEVAATIPEARKVAEGESAEEAKAKDEAFVARRNTLTEKLEQEQKLRGAIYRVARDVADVLMKDRGALVSSEPNATSEASSPIQAVTPAIEVPSGGPSEAVDPTTAAEESTTPDEPTDEQ